MKKLLLALLASLILVGCGVNDVEPKEEVKEEQVEKEEEKEEVKEEEIGRAHV